MSATDFGFMGGPEGLDLVSGGAGGFGDYGVLAQTPGQVAAGPGFLSGIGGPLGAAKVGIAGLQTLGGLWMSYKAQKLANKQFKFTKDITNTNLSNQIKSYNTALADRARGRAVMEGQTDAQRDAYVADNSLNRTQTRPTGYNANYAGASSAAPAATAAPSASGIAGFSALARGNRDEERRGLTNG